MEKINSDVEIKKDITFVPPHPSLKAASWAKSSPKPSINPLMNGKTRLMAAPRSRPHRLGGEYKITGDGLEEDGGDIESSSLPEYCSESEGMVTEDSVKAFGRSLEDIVGVRVLEAKQQQTA